MGKNDVKEGEDIFVTLELEDGEEVETQMLTIFEVDGQDYVVLLPVDQLDSEEGEVFIYRYLESEDGEPGLENIESDKEFEIVSQVFDKIVEEGEYDENVEFEVEVEYDAEEEVPDQTVTKVVIDGGKVKIDGDGFSS